jgi:sulfatase modifying factor 1
MFPRRYFKILPAAVCLALFFTIKVAAISLDLVTVGNLGNPADPVTGRGAVDYSYGIGRYEVTLNEYASFLNAVASTDTYNLYSSAMASDARITGIARSGTPGGYAYSVIGSGLRPVTYVSWFDAARFVNWLHNGQPVGLQSPGSTETGAYSLNGATSGIGFTRSPEAQFWLPSENEWHKAAFHQPAAQGGDSDDFWLYPTRSNSAPDHDQANFGMPDEDMGALVNRLTDAGSFADWGSHYGTFDQAGNVAEWTDSIPDSPWPLRQIGGGSWQWEWEGTLSAFMPHPNDGGEDPRFEDAGTGFRIAGFVTNVPEPSVATLTMLGTLWLIRRRRTRVGGNKA